MNEEQHRGGFAPEPPNTFRGDPLSDPLSDPLVGHVPDPLGDPLTDPLTEPLTDPLRDPLTAPMPGRHVPGYAAGDTGTRAVPIVTVDMHPEEPAASQDDAAPGAGREQSPEPTHQPTYEATYEAHEPTYAPAESTYAESIQDAPYDDEHVVDNDHEMLPLDSGHRAGPRRTRRRGLPGCLAALVAMAVVLALLWVGGAKGYHLIKDHIGGSAADFAGPGTGSVTFEVQKGDSATAIGRNLKAAGVVESVDAFVSAAQSNPDSSRIQVGFYQLKKQMKAADALAVLVDPKSLVQSVVVVPEGARVDQIISTIVAKTDIKKAAVIAALKDTAALGLPAEADGNPEGYLFPATYSVAPGETAAELLTQMVAKGTEVRKDLDLDGAAASVGLTPEQVVTVASILEYEAKRTSDYPKVARAIYNRLADKMPLQSDATVSYANKVSGEVWTTAEQRSNDSPYNTYQHTGLPPGPIGNPGETTLKAALDPASGSWLYWVVVNLKTGETVFSDTLAEHNAAVQKFREYCKTSDAC